jgi:ABC-type multidrug transport system ATPase subunit
MSATGLFEIGAHSRDLVAIENIVKTFGDKRALNGATFSVSAGRICGLLGRNGAGKTTLFRLLMGILKAHRKFKLGGSPSKESGYRGRAEDIGSVRASPRLTRSGQH